MNAVPGVPRLRMLLTAGVLAAAVAAAATFTGALDPIEPHRAYGASNGQLAVQHRSRHA